MDWFEKMPALRAQNVVCPDGQSQCRTGQTCCKLSSGQYGCCPLPKVCKKCLNFYKLNFLKGLNISKYYLFGVLHPTREIFQSYGDVTITDEAGSKF